MLISITEETNKRLRNFIEKRYGGRRGSLSTVIEDAINEYIRQK